MRVFVVEPHPLFRDGLKAAIQTTHDLKVVGEASDPQELASDAPECDVLTLPDTLESLNLARHLGQNGKRDAPFILVVADNLVVHRAVRFLAAGVSGYVANIENPQRVLTAIRMVAQGRKFIPSEVADALVENLGRRAPLSAREYEVLTYIGAGVTVTEIADKLALSVKTVSTYRTRLLEKLRARNNSELIRYALREKIVAIDGEGASGANEPSLSFAP